jgi:hypothetical protein
MTSADDISSTWFYTEPPAKNPVNPMQAFGGENARIRVIKPIPKKAQNDPNGLYVFPTTHGKGGETTLSPMMLGPCRLYGKVGSKSVENAWQYSKVYPQHVGVDGEPTTEYFEWASGGFSSIKAERHPMGKNAKPTFFWWDGQKLNRVEARKKIYVPLYVQRVFKCPYFHKLKKVWEEDIKPESERTLYLMDFDAYEYGSMSLSDVLNNRAKSMGHGFVLAMLLTNDAALKECEIRIL